MTLYKVLVRLNIEAASEDDAEDRAIWLMSLLPAMVPDRDWYVDSIEEDAEEASDGEEFLRKMEAAAAEHAAGLPFGGSE
jgi:hypothetical protein